MTALFACIDLLRLLRDVVYDGYVTYSDYVRYGNAFLPVGRSPVAYTPAERQLKP
jgi:hypothetical protein